MFEGEPILKCKHFTRLRDIIIHEIELLISLWIVSEIGGLGLWSSLIGSWIFRYYWKKGYLIGETEKLAYL